jgi:hypothetical protein
MASVRCIRPAAPVQTHPGTVVDGHRDLPAGVPQVKALTFTESEQSPWATSMQGRADRRIFAPGWPTLAVGGGAQIIYSAIGPSVGAACRCGITALSAAESSP